MDIAKDVGNDLERLGTRLGRGRIWTLRGVGGTLLTQMDFPPTPTFLIIFANSNTTLTPDDVNVILHDTIEYHDDTVVSR